MPVQKRLVSMSTPLRDDTLVLRQAKFKEALGQPFTLEVEMVSNDESLNFTDILGKTLTVHLETEKHTRHINGVVTSFEQKENIKQNAAYVAVIRPWIYLLNLSKKCRIFQQKSYPEIIKTVFDELGFSDYEDKLSQKYAKQDYVVQFGETDFDFISRIMQQEGIFYTFSHTKSKHSLILHDDNARLQDIGKIPYFELVEQNKHLGVEGIKQWENKQQVKSGSFSLSSYDFELPNKNLQASTKDPKVKQLSHFERSEYQLGYNERKTGEHYSKVLMERENTSFSQTWFSGDIRTLESGVKFTLKDHMREDQNAQHLVTSIECVIRSDELFEQDELNQHSLFEFSATAMPARLSFRPPVTIPSPIMRGPQTATVVGKNKEEIWTDKYGRIKVQFHWDQYTKGNENSSCWIRVAQSMAGKNWGSVYIPRVGQEVLVDFLQGDPNQPIVVACIYNGSNLPPYPLPQHSTMSGFRSRTTGNAGTFSEIRFEDKKGDEQLFIHAAKNQDISITQDCFETVGGDRHLTVKKNQHSKVHNNRFDSIDGDSTQKVGKDFNLSIEGKEAKEVGQSISLSVGSNGSYDYAGNLSINSDKDSYLKAKNICLEASSNITLKVGNSFIAIERGGISISTSGNISLDAKGKLSAKASSAADIKAGGPVSIKGATVKIN
ncbi:type VI secretion system Vgr family protein [Glaciecola sp. 1036]|uniref:type VI secretion system Vgr family protein n=1 Tax=Alteromonadaceae TaxID=72275 RepID=UPI003CFD3015